MTESTDGHEYSLAQFSGQFLACRSLPEVPVSWSTRNSCGWFISAHPTLRITELNNDHDECIGWLVGSPTGHGRLIEGSLCISGLRAVDRDAVAVRLDEELHRLGGAWIAIIVGGAYPLVMTDAFGHFPMVYCPPAQSMASSPSLIRETSETHINSQLVDSIGIKPHTDGYYPFGLTPRHNVHRLLPNHYLALETWEMLRVWPRTPTTSTISVREAAAAVSATIKDNLAAIASGHSMEMAITAGYDSRVIVACLRRFTACTRFFTSIAHPTSGSLDLIAAKDIARRNGITLSVVVGKPRTQEERSAWLCRTGESGDNGGSQMIYPDLGRDERVVLFGQAGEVLRGYFYKDKHPKEWATDYSPEDILRIIKCSADDPHVLSAASRWLETLDGYSGEALLDLLYLEQRVACWPGALVVGHEWWPNTFWPFCHRSVADIMLKVPTEAKQKSLVHVEIVRSEWPELLQTPLNTWFGWRSWPARYPLLRPQFWKRQANRVSRKLGKLACGRLN